LLIWNGSLDVKIYSALQSTQIKRRLLLNATGKNFDLQIDTTQVDTHAQLQYIQQTLERIVQ